jgi:hypothetical protein
MQAFDTAYSTRDVFLCRLNEIIRNENFVTPTFLDDLLKALNLRSTLRNSVEFKNFNLVCLLTLPHEMLLVLTIKMLFKSLNCP